MWLRSYASGEAVYFEVFVSNPHRFEVVIQVRRRGSLVRCFLHSDG
jgi:hypothetical protein